MRRLVSAITCGFVIIGCGIAVTDESESMSIAEQLAAKGFEKDPSIPTREPHRGLEVSHFAAEGRGAMLISDRSSGSEWGAIFDANTGLLIEELQPPAADSLEPPDKGRAMATSSCYGYEVDWSWTSYVSYNWECSGQYGWYCVAQYSYFDHEKPLFSECSSVSCACGFGSGAR